MQKYTELSIEERAVIQVSLSMGISQRGIAKKLKRSPSTISREIKRNSVSNEYTVQAAQQIRYRKRLARLGMDTILHTSQGAPKRRFGVYLRFTLFFS